MIRAIVLSFVAGVILSPDVNRLAQSATPSAMQQFFAAFSIDSYEKIVAALP
jgi:hypothetical protein